MITSRAITGERLVNVLQSIALKQQTGRLSIEQGHEQGKEGEKGEIFFAHGNTVFARTRNQLGETALFTMLHWQEIQYAFIESEKVPQSTIQPQQRRVAPRTNQGRPMLPIELEETRQTPAIGMPAIPKSVRNAPVTSPHLLGHVSTRLFPGVTSQPQQAVVSSQSPQNSALPSIHAIFRALPLESMPKIINQMERKDRIVFLLLDGNRPLSTIRHLVHRSEVDIAHTIVHLLKQGYIEYIQG